jgi:hypothetical protein
MNAIDPEIGSNARAAMQGPLREARLIAHFGADATCPDVRMALAHCDKRKNYGDRCGARLTDLARR